MRAPHAATLFFSGGVDSALLAARLAQAGRNDIRLVNYAFGAEDEESRLALRIADCLGLECHRILHDVRQIPQVFESLGKSYTYPYGDISVVPTKLLVENAIRQGQISGTVIEGTGADGGFGVGANYPRWRKLYAVPAPVRWVAAESYRALKLWRAHNRQEHLCRIARKSVTMPMRHAAMAENALEGIAYVTPRDIRASLRQMIEANLEILSVQTEEAERLSLLDVAWVCAGRMASKSFDPLRAQGIQPIYPFLEPQMAALSSALTWQEKAEGGEPKAVLKRMLARAIPSELVYRRKSGFTPPQKDLLATPAMREFLHDVALSQRNPLLAYCRTDIVRQIVELMQRGQPLGESARDFLWALAFTSGWLAQVQD
jgi:asparagine synthetase B (glutamine-hydrolysing)